MNWQYTVIYTSVALIIKHYTQQNLITLFETKKNHKFTKKLKALILVKTEGYFINNSNFLSVHA